MTVFKCKMCGGDLEVDQKSKIATCQHCGSTMTLPRLDDERIANLYDRANHYRRSNDFDKAVSVYELILNENKADAEAYWCLVLCKYGIEYVVDPRTHKRIPTCNRTLMNSILADSDYLAAIQYADLEAKILYENEAKVIDGIQKVILEIAGKEDPVDIFISYKETDSIGRRTKDSVLAQEIYYALKEEGYRLFFSRISLESVLGSAYEPYIFAALNSAKIMIVVGTQPDYFNSPWVKNEWSRFLNLSKGGQKKILIPTYKDMDPYDLPHDFSHLQALDMSKLGFIQDLVRGIRKMNMKGEPQNQESSRIANVEPTTTSLLKRAFINIEDDEFAKADEIIERVLDLDPESGRAYIAKVLIEQKMKEIDDLSHYSGDLESNKYYLRAKKYADHELRNKLIAIEEIHHSTKKTREDEDNYNIAVNLHQNKNFADALEFYKKVPNYKDSEIRMKECTEMMKLIEKASTPSSSLLANIYMPATIMALLLRHKLQDHQLFYIPVFDSNQSYWICSCGTQNPMSSSACSCGISKDFAESLLNKEETEKQGQQIIDAYRKEKRPSDTYADKK